MICQIILRDSGRELDSPHKTRYYRCTYANPKDNELNSRHPRRRLYCTWVEADINNQAITAENTHKASAQRKLFLILGDKKS